MSDQTDLLIDNFKYCEPELLKQAVIARQMAATCLTTEILEGQKMLPNPVTDAICKILDDVVQLKRKRVIITIPPGYGKTMNCVWSFISRGLVVNPAARFFHTSYSNDLVLDNSSKVKQILESEAYEYFNGKLNIVNDTRSKGLWRTEEGGGLRAVPIGGGLAGFRAGQVDKDKFTGCFIADDLLKPDDATSRVICAAQNRRYNTSISSRLAHEDVPIVMIMQRIVAYAGDFNTSEDLADCGDMVEYLLRGGSGEQWDHLMLPALIDNSLEYPKEWTHGNPIEHDLSDGPLWEYKHKIEDIKRLKAADKYTYAAQYDQRPKKRIGEPMISGEWFGYYDECPPLKAIEIFADTASKTAERNDYSVLLVAGVTHDDKLMILDVVRGKWKIPELYKKTEGLWELWKSRGATRIQIEDANSGTYLIQQLEIKLKKSVIGVPRLKDKFTRVNGIIETISSGNVYLPNYGAWVADFIDECESFTDDDSHMHDDQVDCLVDAVERLLPMRKGATIRLGIAGAA